jgi:DUF917 family protein
MKFTVADIPALSLGAAVLGTGGGGDPYIGGLTLRRMMETGVEPRILAVEELADDAFVVPIGAIGSPATALEKLSSVTLPRVIVERVEQIMHRKVDAVMPAEIGGVNSLIPLMSACATGLPVVDADGMGRAYPTVDRTTFSLKGIEVCPLIMTNDHGDTVRLDMSSPERTEGMARMVATEFGGGAMSALYTMTGRQVKDTAVHGTLTLATQIGRAIIAARAAKLDPFAAIFNTLAALTRPIRGTSIYDGKIVALERKMQRGYNIGEGLIEGLDAFRGSHAGFSFQNEYLYIRRDGRLIAMVPDLICFLDRETAQPVTCESVRYGQRVRVIALETDPAFQTAAALRRCGPRSFGIDADYASFLDIAQATRS